MHCGPGVDSAYNRNEYQKSSWGVKVWRVHTIDSLTTIWAECLENVGSSTSHKPTGLHSLLKG
jgi:hypothetical protein